MTIFDIALHYQITAPFFPIILQFPFFFVVLIFSYPIDVKVISQVENALQRMDHPGWNLEKYKKYLHRLGIIYTLQR